MTGRTWVCRLGALVGAVLLVLLIAGLAPAELSVFARSDETTTGHARVPVEAGRTTTVTLSVIPMSHTVLADAAAGGTVEPGDGFTLVFPANALADAAGPFGNPTSDSARTMVTLATTEALIVVFAPAGLGASVAKHALQAAAELSAKFINDRHLPDKAIDVVDEAGASLRLKPEAEREKTVTVAHIEAVVARIARIPARNVSTSDREVLANLQRNLKLVIYGQDAAIDAQCRGRLLHLLLPSFLAAACALSRAA